MSEPVRILTIFDPLPARDTILKFNGFLMARGATHDQDCGVIRNDTTEARFEEAETGLGLDASLERIYTWESLGLIEYWFHGGMIEVHFDTTVSRRVEAIAINVLRPEYHREWKKYLHFCIDLHDLLQAKRTIIAGGVHGAGCHWREELERVKKHIYKEGRDLDLDIKFDWTGKARD